MTKKKKKNSVLGFDKIEVLGHTIKVLETDNADDLLSGNALCFGLYIPTESKIIVSTRQSPQNMKQTFYHELLHCIDFLTHNEEFKYDEEVVNVLARGLHTVKLG